MPPRWSSARLRACLTTLTDAYARRAADDSIYLDVATLVVSVDSRLEDVDARVARAGRGVPAPDGLFEWRVRRDFVRSLSPGPLKTRLGETLAGPKTRRRFELVVQTARVDGLVGCFARYRRQRLRAYAARVIRGFLA